MRFAFFALLSLAFLATSTFAAGTADSTFVVERVIDGDTIVIAFHDESTRVRFIGVDTPETKHPRKPVECYGPEASTFTENLLKGERVLLRYGDERRDRYDRLLAYVYRAPDWLHVNAELVRQGYAKAYIRFPFEHSDRFIELQARAQAAGKGVWNACE